MTIHLLMDEKFTSDFIELVDKEFNENKNHIFLIVTRHEQLRYRLCESVKVVFIRQNLKSLLLLANYIIKAQRIIAHGLFNHYLIMILYFLNAAHKTIWAIWGGDLYDYQKEKCLFFALKKGFIKKLYGVATIIEGDVKLAREVYGFRGKFIPCLLYLSNVIDRSLERKVKPPSLPYTILIGNSADNENRHEYIFEKIKSFDLKDARIIIPLSYGPQLYADHIQRLYSASFGSNVTCLRNFIPKEDYLRMLSEVDCVLFAHNRQQGVGNLIQLIDIGAKIYLEPYVTTYKWLCDLGIKVFNIELLDDSSFVPLAKDEKEQNRMIIRNVASKEKLIKQLSEVFLA